MPKKPEISRDNIINSQAFKAINYLIDEKVALMKAEAKGMIAWAKSQDKDMLDRIDTRAYEEGGGVVIMPIDVRFCDVMAGSIKRYEQLKNEVHSLVRYKLRLLNDYDFTKGDDSDQRAVFGKEK